MANVGAHLRTDWRVDGKVADLTRPRPAPKSLAIRVTPQHLIVDANRTACIVVDMQNDFCASDGWLASIGVDTARLREPIAPLESMLPALRHAGVPVVWVNWGTRPDRANLPPGVIHVYDPDGTGTGIGDPLPSTGRPVLARGSASAAIVDGLTVAPQDLHVDKSRMTGFVDTELDSILRNLDVSTLLFCGVNVDQCVLATLMDAAALGYDCLLVEDCAATSSPNAALETTIYNVAQCFGFVTESGAILEGLATAPWHGSPRHAEVHSAIEKVAYRISLGDSVKLVPLRIPGDGFDGSVFLEIWDVGGSQPPNTHPEAVETFFILSGEAVAYSDGDVVPLGRGDFLVLPARTMHRIENIGTSRLFAVTTMQPDNGFADLVTRGTAEPLGEEDLAWAGAAARGY